MSQINDGQQGKKGLGAGAIIGIVIGVVALIVLVCGGVGVALLLPALGKARQAAQQTVAMSQAKQLVMVANEYAAFNKDFLLSQANWSNEVSVFVGDPSTQASLLDDNPRVEGSPPDWIYLSPIPREGEAHARMADIINPGSTVLFHENLSRLPERFDMVVVGMADGSVQMMSRAELIRIATAQSAGNTPK